VEERADQRGREVKRKKEGREKKARRERSSARELSEQDMQGRKGARDRCLGQMTESVKDWKDGSKESLELWRAAC
jgi:hypothetical protein